MNEIDRTLSILAIDDDPADLKLLKMSIKKAELGDFDFHGFTSWKEAEPQLKNLVVDVIFVDYLLGSDTGLDVVKAIREGGDFRPVIVLTGHGDPVIAAKITRAGADDFLIKKDLDNDILPRAITNSITQYRLRCEKELLSEQLIQSQKMETIGSLSGGIAHDFNNMLSAVIGGIELAGYISKESEVRIELEKAKKVCRQMADLVKQLLNFSRKSSSDVSTLDLSETMEQLKAILIHTLPKTIKLNIHIHDEKTAVLANSTNLQQVLLNLCVNASEAMANNGLLTLRTKDYSIESDLPLIDHTLQKGDYIIIEVSDNGEGIDPDVINRIFEPFFTTKQLGTQKGTGLGLSIAWQNCKRMGGTIRVDSRKGEGTTFSVILPKGSVETKESRGAEPYKITKSQGNETILIVDDEKTILNMTQNMLKRLGYNVFPASDGDTALEIFSEKKDSVDLVILDVSMPGMDGFTCFKELIKMKPSQKIYFASGHNMSSMESKMYDLGAGGVLQKPYSFKILASVVEKAFSKKN